MPFVEMLHRAVGHIACAVGDICYKYYKPMVDKWRKERRWTTAHNIARETFNLNDEDAAKYLAFLEFYIREVHPYENEKKEQNGDVA